MTTSLEIEKYKKEFEKELIERYGPLLTTEPLSKLLGFKSINAFKAGISRKTIAVPIFSIENRHGKFALTKDVAAWLVSVRFESILQVEDEPTI